MPEPVKQAYERAKQWAWGKLESRYGPKLAGMIAKTAAIAVPIPVGGVGPTAIALSLVVAEVCRAAGVGQKGLEPAELDEAGIVEAAHAWLAEVEERLKGELDGGEGPEHPAVPPSPFTRGKSLFWFGKAVNEGPPSAPAKKPRAAARPKGPKFTGEKVVKVQGKEQTWCYQEGRRVSCATKKDTPQAPKAGQSPAEEKPSPKPKAEKPSKQTPQQKLEAATSSLEAINTNGTDEAGVRKLAEQLTALTVPQLKELTKKYGIKPAPKALKAQIVAALQGLVGVNPIAPEKPAPPVPAAQRAEEPKEGEKPEGKAPKFDGSPEAAKRIANAIETAARTDDGVTSTARVQMFLRAKGINLPPERFKDFLAYAREHGGLELHVLNEVRNLQDKPDWKANTLWQNGKALGYVAVRDPKKLADAWQQWVAEGAPERDHSKYETAEGEPEGKAPAKPSAPKAPPGKAERPKPPVPPQKPAVKKESLPFGKLPNVKAIYDGKAKAYAKEIFGGDVTDGQLGAMANAIDGARVSVQPVMQGRVAVFTSGPGYTAERHFYRDKAGSLVVHNESIEIAEDSPLKGKGAFLFADQATALRGNGVSRIETTAAGMPGDKDVNGYYTWPRLGYDAPLDPKRFTNPKVAEAARKQFPQAKSVLDVFSSPGGREWWKENGGEFEAEFDLNPNSRSSRVLAAYIEERKTRGS